MLWSVQRFALRVGVLFLIVAGVFATHLAVAKPRLPFVVLASIERAFSQPQKLTILDVLNRYEADILVACDAASESLDRALAGLESQTLERRAAAYLVTMKHLELARGDLAHAPTAEEFTEYDATCERLRGVRRRLA